MATTWYVNLLGPFQLQVGDHVVETERWVSKKGLALFELLLTSKDNQMARDQLLVTLWPDEDRDNARKRLHSTVYFLRQALAPYGGDEPLISYVSGMYRFRPPGQCIYDTNRFTAFYEQAAAVEAMDAAEASTLYLSAIGLYRGHYLAHQPLQPSFAAKRAHFHELYVQAIVKAGAYAADNNDLFEALRLFRLGLGHDPLHEHMHQALIKTLLAAGRYGEATQHFRTFRKQLRDQYGVEPSPVLQQLIGKKSTGPKDTAPLAPAWLQPMVVDVADTAPFQHEAIAVAKSYGSSGEAATVVRITFAGPVTASHRKHLTTMLSQHVRHGDRLSWATGSELRILLPRTNPRWGPAIRARVRQLLAKMHSGLAKVTVVPAHEVVAPNELMG